MEEISKGMVTPLPVQYSKFLKDAMEGPGTTEAELTEILCGNDNAMIRDIVQSYTERMCSFFFQIALKKQLFLITSAKINLKKK